MLPFCHKPSIKHLSDSYRKPSFKLFVTGDLKVLKTMYTIAIALDIVFPKNLKV